MIDTLRSRYPALLVLLAHLLGTVLVFLLMQALHALFDYRPTLWMAACAQAMIAALWVSAWRLSRWWVPISLVFAPGLIVLSGQALPAWVFLIGFVLLLLLNWNSVSERVPLYLTGKETQARLGDILAERATGFRFIDLGSGLAGTLCTLARRFPESQFVGVETAPLSFALSWLRCLPYRNCSIRYQSLWKVSLADFDVVYCFLSPAPMPELWEKAQRELCAGAWLISNTFEIPDAAPDRLVALEDWRDSKLLIWMR